jgi:CBS domain-containing protein
MHLAKDSLQFKPPLSFFKNIVVETSGPNKDKFSIKKAMASIVDFARIYALQAGIMDNNTAIRLKRLYEESAITRNEYDELIHAYTYLMKMRLLHQSMSVSVHREPDNYINPRSMTHFEKKMLVEALSTAGSYQTKMKTDYRLGE